MGIKGEWDAYRKAYPKKRMIVGQWGLQGDRGDPLYGGRGLGDALYVPLFLFLAAAYDIDPQHPEQHGFLERLAFYQLKNIIDRDNQPNPVYDAFAMVGPAFSGDVRVAYQAACPGGDDRCRLILVERAAGKGAPLSTLYAINLRPYEVPLRLQGVRGPGTAAVRIESLSGPNLMANYVNANNRALHAVTSGTAEVTLVPRSFTAISWPAPSKRSAAPASPGHDRAAL